MLNFEIGEMFWGKSLSYPWWPCVLVANNKNEVRRNIRKVGTQYHVQFIGSEYDVCWITDEFLIEYEGKEQFESFMEGLISTDLSVEDRHKYDMRMSSSVQTLWIKACTEAEIVFSMNVSDRLTRLPRRILEPIVVHAPMKRGSSRGYCNGSIRDKVMQYKDIDDEKHTDNVKAPKMSFTKVSYIEDEFEINLDVKEVKKNLIEKKKESIKSLVHVSNNDMRSKVETVIKDDVKKSDRKKSSSRQSYSKLLNGEGGVDMETVTSRVVRSHEKTKMQSKRSFPPMVNDMDAAKETKEVVKKIKDRKMQPKKFYDFEAECHTDANSRTKEIFVANDSCLSKDIERRCFRAYLIQETNYRLENMNQATQEADLERTLKEQWSALDIDTKLLYLNDDVNFLVRSKSKSGRKIKIPSRLRRTEDIAKIRMESAKKYQKVPLGKKRCSESIPIISVLSVKAEDMDASYLCDSTVSMSSLDRNSVDKEVIDDSLWCSLSFRDCKTEMMRMVVSRGERDLNVHCYHCFKKLLPEDHILTCKGHCRSLYHFHCAVQNKILRADNTSLCPYCTCRQSICCVCKNSTYVNQTFLVKCPRDGCSYYFHITCVKYLTQCGNKSDDNDLIDCLNHSCLTCSREDNKHPCRSVGPFASCVRCSISYHDNFVCIPAGGRPVSKNKIVCYRHFDNDFELNRSQRLSRCFVCFNENASLKCCRCRAIFHRKCVAMATYTDLLRDYVCDTCRLDRPVFHGQVVWIERETRWAPAEIINPYNALEDLHIKYDRPLIVRDLKSDKYYYPTRRELVSFETGLSILRNVIDVSNPVIQKARIMHILYWNWRARLRPVTSEKFPLIVESQLLEHSLYDYQSVPQTGATYVLVYENVVNEDIQKLIPQARSSQCCCASFHGSCSDHRCANFVSQLECNVSNCGSALCKNRLFERRIHFRKGTIRVGTPNRGIILDDIVKEDQLFGECTGVLMSLAEVTSQINKRQQWRIASHMFHLLGEVYLCCEHVGNEWRHLNHSCDPNARLICRNVSGKLRLGVSALRVICNEEVTIDYREGAVMLKYGFFCKCQAPNCAKIIGPTFALASEGDRVVPRCCLSTDARSSPSTLAGRQPRVSALKESTIVNGDHCEDHSVIEGEITESTSCHRCGRLGELVACDRANCGRQYHLCCIESSTRPVGIWLCPVHFCYYCGESATKLCHECPISCCLAHSVVHVGHRCSRGVNAGDMLAEESEQQATSGLSNGPIKTEGAVNGVADFVWLPNEDFIDEDSHVVDTLIQDVHSVKAEVHECAAHEAVTVIVDVHTVTEDAEGTEDTENTEWWLGDVYDLGGGAAMTEDISNECSTGGDVDNELTEPLTVEIAAPKSSPTGDTSCPAHAVDMDKEDLVISPGQHIGLSKEELYRACDLVPFLDGGQSTETRTTKDSPLSDYHSKSINTTNCVSKDDYGVLELEHLSEKQDSDLDDVRFEIRPYSIVEMEDVIISPPILDD